MINNNMNMLKSMVNIFDYEEYSAKCKEKQVPINYMQQFCVGIGVLLVGRDKYPDLDWQEAYTRMFDDMNEAEEKAPEGGCERKESHLPSHLQQAKNLIGATVRHVRAGLPMVDDAEYSRRLKICSSNECGKLVKNFRCLACGCYMKTKARWAEEKCKLNKW